MFNLLTFRTLMLACYFCTLSFLPCASHLQQQSFPSPHPSHCGFLAVSVLYILCERYASAAATMTIVTIYCHIIVLSGYFLQKTPFDVFATVLCFDLLSPLFFLYVGSDVPQDAARNPIRIAAMITSVDFFFMFG